MTFWRNFILKISSKIFFSLFIKVMDDEYTNSSKSTSPLSTSTTSYSSTSPPMSVSSSSLSPSFSVKSMPPQLQQPTQPPLSSRGSKRRNNSGGCLLSKARVDLLNSSGGSQSMEDNCYNINCDFEFNDFY